MKADPNCSMCHGLGGWHWEAPIYHNERQIEWMNCGCDEQSVRVIVNPGLPTQSTLEVFFDDDPSS